MSLRPRILCARFLLALGAPLLAASEGCRLMRGKASHEDAGAECRELSRQGASAMELGAWDRAELLLRKAAEASPTDPDARRRLAEALWRRGSAEEAVTEAETAAQLDPYDARLAVVAGEMLLATGEAEKAADLAERAIGLDANMAEAWALRGRAFRALRLPDRALADLQRSLSLRGGDPGVLSELARLHHERGAHNRALTTVHELLDGYAPGSEPPDALILEGQTYMALARPEMAIESLRAALERGAPRADTLCALAEAEALSGRPVDAVATAQQALAADASHEPSRQLLARLSAGPAAPQIR